MTTGVPIPQKRAKAVNADKAGKRRETRKTRQGEKEKKRGDTQRQRGKEEREDLLPFRAGWSCSFRSRDKSDGLFNLATHCHSFRATLLCLFAPSSSSGLRSTYSTLSRLSPFRRRIREDDDEAKANGADRNSGGLGRKAIEGRFLLAAARDRARSTENDLFLFFSWTFSPGCDWNKIPRREFYCARLANVDVALIEMKVKEHRSE